MITIPDLLYYHFHDLVYQYSQKSSSDIELQILIVTDAFTPRAQDEYIYGKYIADNSGTGGEESPVPYVIWACHNKTEGYTIRENQTCCLH
jgi:hypothetical protein